jgi:hypothetical protein
MQKYHKHETAAFKMSHSRDIYEIAAETSLTCSGTRLLEHLQKPQILKFLFQNDTCKTKHMYGKSRTAGTCLFLEASLSSGPMDPSSTM